MPGPMWGASGLLRVMFFVKSGSLCPQTTPPLSERMQCQFQACQELKQARAWNVVLSSQRKTKKFQAGIPEMASPISTHRTPPRSGCACRKLLDSAKGLGTQCDGDQGWQGLGLGEPGQRAPRGGGVGAGRLAAGVACCETHDY